VRVLRHATVLTAAAAYLRLHAVASTVHHVGSLQYTAVDCKGRHRNLLTAGVLRVVARMAGLQAASVSPSSVLIVTFA
jgi:hypothetical protein